MQLTPEEKQDMALDADELLVEFYDKEQSVVAVKLNSVRGWDNRPKLGSKARGQEGLSGAIARANKAFKDGRVSA